MNPLRYDYNPFDKPFDALTTSDLGALRSVPEGWYVEYKREAVNANSVAKSITALANTFGGWVFYGVTEATKDNPVAGSFPGIPSNEADAVLQRIRQAVANHAQPSPFYQAKALKGPVQALDLPDDRCVIAVFVPWGSAAPYIHKDGRIYRRVSDGSEPKNETDRYQLDRLWGRSGAIIKRYAQWVDSELETSKAEDDAPFLRLFLIADFWQDHPPLEPLSIGKVREIFGKTGSYTTPYPNIFSSADGFVCRQVNKENPSAMGLTWKFSHDLSSEIIIPLSRYGGRDILTTRAHLDGYETIERFLKICREQQYLSPTVLDVNLLLYILLGQMAILRDLATEAGWRGSFFAKMKISGVWRCIPFLDLPEYSDEVQKHGLPLIQNDEIHIRRGEEIDSFLELPALSDVEGNGAYMGKAGGQLFFQVMKAMGLPLLVEHESDPEGKALDYMIVGERALNALKVRGARDRSSN